MRLIEFEVSLRWHSPAVSRSLSTTLGWLDKQGFDCFWQGSAGCLAPASGKCWQQIFGLCPGMVSKAHLCNTVKGDGRPANVLCARRGRMADSLWAFANRCRVTHV